MISKYKGGGEEEGKERREGEGEGLGAEEGGKEGWGREGEGLKGGNKAKQAGLQAGVCGRASRNLL